MIGTCILPAKGQEVKISKLDINEKGSNEIAPIVHDSVLYFISNRKNGVLLKINNQNNEYLYKVYQTNMLPDGKLGETSIFQPDKSFKLSAGSVSFSSENKFHIATLNKESSFKAVFFKSKKNKNLLGLYESYRESPDKWGKYHPIKFSEISKNSFAQQTLSSDGQTLVFVSDKRGGYGGTDLYYSTLTESGWSDPINLGSKINSEKKELFPFFHSSGKLYFSSNRAGGLGGFDIYYSIYENEEWSEPVCLQAPINSKYDDFSCYIFPDETSGFFASSRDGKDNIYRFEYVMRFCEYPQEVEEENYCFTFFEERAIIADTIPVKYQWDFGDGDKVLGVEADHCFDGPGEYKIVLSVIDSLSDEYLYSVAEYEMNLEKPKQVYFYLPEKVNVNTEVVLKAELSGFGDVENVRYFWSVEEDKTVVGESISYRFSKKGIYTIRCEAYWGNGQSICSQRTLIVN
jgi:plastocyanin